MSRLLHKLSILVSVLLSQSVTFGYLARHPLRMIGSGPRSRTPVSELLAQRRVESILVVKLDGLGDFVLATPLLRSLREHFTSARIVFIVDEWLAESVAAVGLADEVIGFNWRGAIPAAARRAAKLAAQRLSEPFDLAIVPRWEIDSSYASLLAFLSGADYRLGFSRKVFAKKRLMNLLNDAFYTHVIVAAAELHEVEKNVALAEAVGIEVSCTQLTFRGSPLPSELEDLFPGKHGESRNGAPGTPVIAFGIGAMGPNRKWPIDGFVAVARWTLAVYTDARIVLLGGDDDRPNAERICEEAESHGRVVDLTGKLTLNQSFEALKHCSLFVGNDSGPKHLASAAGTPIVELSSFPLGGDPTHYSAVNRFGSWGKGAMILQPERALPPCTGACIMYRPHCITTISPERVISAMKKILSEVTV